MEKYPNKKICITKSVDIFILNKNSVCELEKINPVELLIINTDYFYSPDFFYSLNNINPDTKSNTTKIITSDIIITMYFNYLDKKIYQLFPNCTTIVIYSFQNIFSNISKILDDLEIKNVEYILDSNVFLSNSIYYYHYFFESFFNGKISNIKNVIIKNQIMDYNKNIDDNKNIQDTVIENILKTLITKEKINKKNTGQINNIVDWDLIDKCMLDKTTFNPKYINLMNIEYNDKNNNILIVDKIINIKEQVLFSEGILL